MSAFLRSLLRASRVTRATLLLGVFVLGAALHGLHHLQDPACADGRDLSGHACAVCATLHGSTLVAAEVAAPAPSVAAWLPPVAAALAAPRAQANRAAAPRAPPAS